MTVHTINFFGKKISYLSLKETLIILFDLFIRKEYDFDTKEKSPYIIDCGAHIGLSIFWFKNKHPKAKILAFEADPKAFKLLEKNLKQNNITKVKTIEAAVCAKRKNTDFFISKQNSGNSLWANTINKELIDKKNFKKIKVRTAKLSDHIKSEVDLLKLDIEGAEKEVIEDIKNKLNLVKKIIFEYHGNKKDLKKILKTLKAKNFDYRVKRVINKKEYQLKIIESWNKKYKDKNIS